MPMNSRIKRVFFGSFAFDVFESVYEPAEDSFLLAQNLQIKKDDLVLDIGTGCGIQAILTAQKVRKVLAVDVNPNAARCAVHNATLNHVADKVEVRQGNLFEPMRAGEKFDVIIFNAPYLPSESGEERDLASRAWAGGRSGRRVIDCFIVEAPAYLKINGRVFLVQSTLSNVEESLRMFTDRGLGAEVIAERKVEFETIVIIQAKR